MTSERSSIWTPGGIVAGVAAVALALVLGLLFPRLQALPSSSETASVAATGHTTRVEVEAREGMVFSPSRIEVPAGDKLVISLKNTDPMNQHDLVVGDQRTKRLAPGESEELVIATVASSIQGYCSVAGHKQMGMTLDIVAQGGVAATASDASGSATSAGESTGHAGHGKSDAKLSGNIPAELPPLEANAGPTVRKVNLTVTELPLEVAPGVYQKRWTFNGASMGPVLHGRVGDTFEVTLTNDGSMGHSIDFHAGALAPDTPMRTIAPGESLVYTFHAERAGIWMYHCSTAPMSTHIAAGMHGAVVIEPEGLPEVDHSYVFVQSEVYMGAYANTPEDAEEVGADKIAAREHDYVVFNGIANQYDQFPLEVKTGDRVRFWVLDAGPNEPLAFHIVGTQFDTTFVEGAYTLKDGAALANPYPATKANAGGSQVLSLLPAEGGFVELTVPEAGHYSIVNHIMSDAEAGAHGILQATDR